MRNISLNKFGHILATWAVIALVGVWLSSCGIDPSPSPAPEPPSTPPTSQEVGVVAYNPLLVGSFLGPCRQSSASNPVWPSTYSSRGTVTITSDARVIFHTRTFEGTRCSGSRQIAEVKTSMSQAVFQEYSGESPIILRAKLDSMVLRFLPTVSQRELAHASERNLCGYQNWQPGVDTEISGQWCFANARPLPSRGSSYVDTIQIDNQKLTMDYTPLGFKAGQQLQRTTPITRVTRQSPAPTRPQPPSEEDPANEPTPSVPSPAVGPGGLSQRIPHSIRGAYTRCFTITGSAIKSTYVYQDGESHLTSEIFIGSSTCSPTQNFGKITLLVPFVPQFKAAGDHYTVDYTFGATTGVFSQNRNATSFPVVYQFTCNGSHWPSSDTSYTRNLQGCILPSILTHGASGSEIRRVPYSGNTGLGIVKVQDGLGISSPFHQGRSRHLHSYRRL